MNHCCLMSFIDVRSAGYTQFLVSFAFKRLKYIAGCSKRLPSGTYC